MSEISLRCVGNKQDFICNENNPSLSRDKQEIPVREEELPKKSKVEQGRICSERFNSHLTLTNIRIFQIILTDADQAVWSKCTMKKIYFIPMLSKRIRSNNPTKEQIHTKLPIILLPSLPTRIVLPCENENQTPYLPPYHHIILVLPKPVRLSCSKRVQLWSST